MYSSTLRCYGLLFFREYHISNVNKYTPSFPFYQRLGVLYFCSPLLCHFLSSFIVKAMNLDRDFPSDELFDNDMHFQPRQFKRLRKNSSECMNCKLIASFHAYPINRGTKSNQRVKQASSLSYFQNQNICKNTNCQTSVLFKDDPEELFDNCNCSDDFTMKCVESPLKRKRDMYSISIRKNKEENRDRKRICNPKIPVTSTKARRSLAIRHRHIRVSRMYSLRSIYGCSKAMSKYQIRLYPKRSRGSPHEETSSTNKRLKIQRQFTITISTSSPRRKFLSRYKINERISQSISMPYRKKKRVRNDSLRMPLM